MAMAFLASFVFGFLLGAIPFALAAAKIFRLPDPRHYGSGNPGATNIARSGHKPAAILTLFADIGKGAAAVAIVDAVFHSPAAAVAGVAAVAGHIFSPFLKFRGGRGVAAGLGVLVVWQPMIGGGAMLLWLAVFAISRLSSLASLCAMTAAAAAAAVLSPPPTAMAAAVIALLIIFRHRRNIVDMLRGEENSFR